MRVRNEGELRELSERARAAGDRLWRAGAARRAAWLGRALATLADERHALHAAALAELPGSTGLSSEMVRWAMSTALGALTEQAWLNIDRTAQAPNERALRCRAGELCVVVLAGNVFTAAARAVGLPLLFGIPVLARASADDAAFLRALQRALQGSDPELAEAFQAVSFPSSDQPLLDALFERADLVSVYGSDATVSAVRARLPARVSFLAHGHGLGAAIVGERALRDEALATKAADSLALDIAAYDQRGCMSPLVAFVADAQPVAPARFAALLHQSLGALERALPRGPLPTEQASAQISFRGIGAMRGLLLEGERHAICFEADGPLRVSPGYRNVQLLSVRESDTLGDALRPLGAHLKCLGVAGLDERALDLLIDALPVGAAPRVCALGTMQTPGPDAVHDGLAAWAGLLRYVERDL